MSTVGGSGLNVAEVDQTASIELQVNTCTGQPYQQEAEVLATFTHSRSKKTVSPIVRKENDRYKISYCPRERGRHELTVTINGRAVRGSPFSVAVMPSPRQLGKPIKVIGGLSRPNGMAINSRQQIIVAERASGQITMYDDSFSKVNTFDSGGNAPVGVTVDEDDTIYITDLEANVVKRFTANGDFLLEVGEKGCKKLQFNTPIGIAYNKINGKLYVCDQKNHRVQILNTDLTFHSSFGEQGSGEGDFENSICVAFDCVGNVYVTDFNNHRVQVFTADGAFLRTFGTEGNGPGQLNRPLGVAVSPTGVVFVAEKEGNCVSMFMTTSSKVEFSASFGERGSSEGRFSEPAGIIIDNDANIIVAERANGRIQVF